MKKKVIVIGGTGFIGYHVAKFFLRKKYTVISVSRNKPPKKRRIKKVKYLLADITIKKKLYTKLKPHLQTNLIINLGGEVNHNKTLKTFQSHYIGTKNLFEIFCKQKLDLFVQIGSSLEYGKTKSPHKETFKANPISVYARAKFNATKFLKKNKNFPSLILRPYQVYGPKQDTNRLIPFTIKNCLRNKRFNCSSGNQFRDFLYIDDFVNALYICSNTKNKNAEIFNIGSGKTYKVKNIINLIRKKINQGKPIFGKIKLRSEENVITYPLIKKISSKIKWYPKISLNVGLDRTIKSFKIGL